MEYRYETVVGTFTIRPAQEGYELLVDDIPVAVYPSVEEAHRDVTAHSTGWDEWDLMRQIDIPDIDQWEEVSSSH